MKEALPVGPTELVIVVGLTLLALFLVLNQVLKALRSNAPECNNNKFMMRIHDEHKKIKIVFVNNIYVIKSY